MGRGVGSVHGPGPHLAVAAEDDPARSGCCTPASKRTALCSRVPSGRRVVLSWDYSLNTDANHDRAACALASALGWEDPTMAGNLPGPDRVYVVAP